MSSPSSAPSNPSAISPSSTAAPRRILIDARGCTVKAEIYRIAERYGIHTVLVSETEIGAPFEPWLTKIVTGAETVRPFLESEVTPRDILVTDDEYLASGVWARCARVLNTRGQHRTAEGLHPPLPAKAKGNQRSRFVSVLEDEIVALLQQPT